MMRYIATTLLAFGLQIAMSAEDQPVPIYNSISTKPLIEPAANRFLKDHPGPPFSMITGLSSDAIKAVGSGEAAMASVVRGIKEAELKTYPTIKAIPFCIDLLVIVVHKDNPVSDLTVAQVKGLFSGEFQSWKALGGPDAAPVLIARIDTFASLEFFESCFGLKRIVEGEGSAKTMRFKAGGPTVGMPGKNEKALADVIADPNAVTFASLALVNEMQAKGAPIKGLTLGGVAADAASARSGTYSAQRKFNLVVNGTPSERITGLVEFITGPEGKQIVQSKGFIPLSD